MKLKMDFIVLWKRPSLIWNSGMFLMSLGISSTHYFFTCTALLSSISWRMAVMIVNSSFIMILPPETSRPPTPLRRSPPLAADPDLT